MGKGRKCTRCSRHVVNRILSIRIVRSPNPTSHPFLTSVPSVRCPSSLLALTCFLSRAGEEGCIFLFKLVEKPLGDCVQC
jgi:hypothetical protein